MNNQFRNAAVGHCRTVADVSSASRLQYKGLLDWCIYVSRSSISLKSPAAAGGQVGAGGVITCAVPCLPPCRSGRQRATTGTASSATCRATSCRATTASGCTTSSVCRTSSSPETEAPTGSASSAG